MKISLKELPIAFCLTAAIALVSVPAAVAQDGKSDSQTIPSLPKPSLPSAESIIERFIEVTGGREAYESRTSEVTHSTISYLAAGIRGTVVSYSAGGNYRYAMEIPGIGTIEMGVTDGVAWENSVLMGPRIKDGVERVEAMREASLSSTTEWREAFPKVEVAGVEDVDGEPCYAVVMTPEEGFPITTWYSIDSGLAIKTATTTSTQMGDVPFEIRMFDYTEYGGVLAPARTQEVAAGQEIEITIDSLEVNVAIPEEQFALPEEIATLAAEPV